MHEKSTNRTGQVITNFKLTSFEQYPIPPFHRKFFCRLNVYSLRAVGIPPSLRNKAQGNDILLTLIRPWPCLAISLSPAHHILMIARKLRQ